MSQFSVHGKARFAGLAFGALVLVGAGWGAPAGAAVQAPVAMRDASPHNPTDLNPIDKAILDVGQLVYPLPEGWEYDVTPEERAAGLLGFNNYPGSPLGSWAPPGAGLFGQLGQLVQTPPFGDLR